MYGKCKRVIDGGEKAEVCLQIGSIEEVAAVDLRLLRSDDVKPSSILTFSILPQADSLRVHCSNLAGDLMCEHSFSSDAVLEELAAKISTLDGTPWIFFGDNGDEVNTSELMRDHAILTMAQATGHVEDQCSTAATDGRHEVDVQAVPSTEDLEMAMVKAKLAKSIRQKQSHPRTRSRGNKHLLVLHDGDTVSVCVSASGAL